MVVEPGQIGMRGSLCLPRIVFFGNLDPPHKLRLKLHRSAPIEREVDVVVSDNEPEVSHLSAHLNDRRGTFYLEVLDHGYGIAVLEYSPICILDYA